jgi:hypothetical protein
MAYPRPRDVAQMGEAADLGCLSPRTRAGSRGESVRRRCAGWAAGLLLGACGHAQPTPSRDVLTVTELAARYALDYDVPAVLREASPICLSVDGRAPPPEVLARLSQGSIQVSSGASACAGPRAVLLEVSGVSVSGEQAVARVGVRLGPTTVLDFRSVNGQWRVLQPHGQTGAGPVLTLPARP